MLSVTYKPFMLNIIMLNVIMLSEVMLSVIMLSVIMLSVVMLSVIMLNLTVPCLQAWDGIYKNNLRSYYDYLLDRGFAVTLISTFQGYARW